ncbi:MAG: ribosomal protein L7/L12 [Miltoncostaeaceae bacterium]
MSEDLQRRIATLEARVDHLYELLGEGAQAARPVAAVPGGEFPPEVVRLALAGRKIQAIKMLREATGLGLAEAKQVVEQIE